VIGTSETVIKTSSLGWVEIPALQYTEKEIVVAFKKGTPREMIAGATTNFKSSGVSALISVSEYL
jgi:hypothetical protein